MSRIITKKKIAIVFTGGTISMTIDKATNAAAPSLNSEDIMSLVRHIRDFADVDLIDFSAIPGPHMTPEKMMELSKVVQNLCKKDDISGVVITHGTDNLEETAFLLDLTNKTEKPIVFTGSMRNASELGYDGPSNLASAILTAISDDSKNRGVLVVLNDEINAAREVTKTHTMSLDTFKSLEFGPLGIVDSNDVIYYRSQTFEPMHILSESINPDVHLLKVASGMDSTLLNYLTEKKVAGIVIESMGRGNVPPKMMDGIKNALSHNIPIILVSRTPLGRTMPSYGYSGGGLDLKNAGVVLARNLNGQKARIALMLAVSKSKSVNEISDIFS